MPVCPSCGQDNPEIARFCLACGAALADEAAPAREERKVVTVLFCDLVGSTARAEGADPEDVRALLSAYNERVRSELERFGGTVEKFIGDAVMALFGAPTAHEDDPERAVRAALAIRDWAIEEGTVQVRIGITTGEALVALGARPAEGEGMASGDVVNTAARLQGAAAINGILVDGTTFRATERVIDYGEGDSVDAKGKLEPVPVWEVRQAHARVQVEREGRAPLIGRERELDVLLDSLKRVREDREPQLVTLVGVPGIGKSRLVYELFKAIETGGELTFWRHGRALPYGEGISFWALGEIVKAQAGILETDDADRAEAKLREAIGVFVSDPEDAQWLERHLRPLVGLEAVTELGDDRRSEAFAAWRRFLEALAEHRPLVLVFEDLHFADDGLLDFVDYVVEWASGVPLLVVGTARPELLARRPAWGGGKSNAVTISLSPLSDDETAHLVHALLDRSVLDAPLQRTLLDRAGGNPLYAEEFARLIAAGREPAELPETVQGIVAARLDLLPLEEKRVLQDASVVGKVFWLGTVASMGETERWTLEQRLHALERKEFVRRERNSSVAGETEFAFRHILVRDVAYGQMPRAERVEKHRLAAEWIDSLGRPEDHAEMLAYHYLSVLELARATGAGAERFIDRARIALREAGDRALALHAYGSAVRFYENAIELWPDDDADRPELLFGFARALAMAGDERAEGALERARDALSAARARARAAEACALLAELWWHRGQRGRSQEHLEQARQLIDAEGVSSSKAWVLSQLSRYLMLAGEDESAIQAGRQAVAMAETLGLDEVRAHALNNIGCARVHSGDAGGLVDVEQSVDLAAAINSPELSRAYNNLSQMLGELGHVARSLELRRDAVREAEKFGNPRTARIAQGVLIMWEYSLGNWDAFLAEARTFLEEGERLGGSYQAATLISRSALIAAARGEDAVALADARRALELAREVGDPQILLTVLAHVAFTEAELGKLEAARSAALECVRAGSWDAMLALVARRLGIESELHELAEAAPVEDRSAPPLRALLNGEYVVAADAYAEMGLRPLEAHARLRAAESLRAEGRQAEAVEQLERALVFWRSVGATRYIREGEALLAESA